MIRRIITIDEEKCSGCGLCASACHEGAIGMVNGKAKLLHEHYCDGLGDCLPACPENAISFEEREAPAYDEAAVLAADCTAYAYGSFHKDFFRGKVTLIGCPKLDDVDYSKKLLEIFRYNDIRSITVTRMTVPCCGGLTNAVKKALEKSRKDIPLKIITISPRGEIV